MSAECRLASVSLFLLRQFKPSRDSRAHKIVRISSVFKLQILKKDSIYGTDESLMIKKNYMNHTVFLRLHNYILLAIFFLGLAEGKQKMSSSYMI